MFSIRLRLLRKSLGLNQCDFALVFSVTQVTISYWERRIREPDFDTLCKLCDYFDVTADYLLGRD